MRPAAKHGKVWRKTGRRPVRREKTPRLRMVRLDTGQSIGIIGTNYRVLEP